MATNLGVHVSWNGNPGDKYAQFSDVSQYVSQIDTARGRSAELDAVQTGTLSMVLDNADGRFTPGRAYGKELLPANLAAVQSTAGLHAGPNSTLSVVTTPTLSDPNSFAFALTSSHTNGSLIGYTDPVPVVAGAPYRGAVMASRTQSGSAIAVDANLRYYDASGTDLGYGSDLDPAWRQYSDVVLASSPMMYWRLDNKTGTTSAPLASYFPVILNGTTTLVTSWGGGSGQTLSFSGSSSSYGFIGGYVYDSMLPASTIEFWFKTTTKAGALPGGAFINSSGLLGIQFSHGNPAETGPVNTSPYAVTDGLWHHVAITMDGYQGRIYLDGELFASDYPYISDDSILVTPRYQFGNSFNGPIADLAVYGHALTPQIIADHIRHGATGAATLNLKGTLPAPAPWRPILAASTAPANAATARLELIDATGSVATSVYVDTPSIRQIGPLYGKIRPRRKVRVISTTGQNLMPPGINAPYIGGSVPAPLDANEVCAWSTIAGGQLASPAAGVMRYGPTSNQATLDMNANLSSATWILLPGHSYALACQAYAAANTAGQTTTAKITYTLADAAASGSSTLGAGAVTPLTASWVTLSTTINVPATMTAPVLTAYGVSTTETGTGTHTWLTSTQAHQLIDTTTGQTAPVFAVGDGTMPVFSGFVDKWEDTHLSEDLAEVAVTASDAMRILGETDLSVMAGTPEDFSPDLKPLGIYNIVDAKNANLSPVPMIPLFQSGNTFITSGGLTGVYLGAGNTGIGLSFLGSYVSTFGSNASGFSVECWVQADVSAVDGDRFIMGSNNNPIGPIVNHYYNSGSNVHQWSVGWRTRTYGTTKVGQGNFAAGFPCHIAVEVTQTISGGNKIVQLKLYIDGVLEVTANETVLSTFAMLGPIISGNANVVDAGVSLPPFQGNVYGVACYARTGINWASKVREGTADTAWYLTTAFTASQLPAPTIVGSAAVGVGGLTTSGSALDLANNVAGQQGGYAVVTRYGGVAYADRDWRKSSMPVTRFAPDDGTAPDSGILWTSDIDRTWTQADVQDGTGTTYGGWVISDPGGIAQYGLRRTQRTISQWDEQQNYGNPFASVGQDFLTRYMTPAARCDMVRLTAINPQLAAKALGVDVGSRIVLGNLPDNAPASEFYAWTEAVKISAKADGGTLVPTVELTLSPDFTHIDYI
jgi:hypothetical protein